MNTDYELIYVAFGPLHAQTVKLMLEAAGFHVITRQEGAGAALGLTVGPLGEVQILVPTNEVESARKLLEDMDEGRLSGIDFNDEEVEGEDESPPD